MASFPHASVVAVTWVLVEWVLKKMQQFGAALARVFNSQEHGTLANAHAQIQVTR